MHSHLYVLATLLVVAIVAGLLMSNVASTPSVNTAGADEDGPFVAEVWLEWEICRGSTLYRQRFRTERAAERAVRRFARLLDWSLPTHYRDTDYSGRPKYYKHEYEIRFGVRHANAHDSSRLIWSPCLPGTQDFAGEHASLHPLFEDAKLQGSTAGYRL